MIAMTDRFISWADLGGDTASYLVRTSCVIQPRLLATALWLMLTEQVKRLEDRMVIHWAFASVLWQTFLQWIMPPSDDQP
jgi:hypothetical protein